MTGNNGDPLHGLRDIHLPAPVSFWPPAPGWWLLAILIVIAFFLALWWWRRYQRRAYRRAALRQLRQLQLALREGEADTPIIAELSILLRRTAISRYGRQQVAALHGMSWLEFLDRTGRNTTFASEGRALLEAPYRRRTAHTAEPLLNLAQRWLQVQS